MKRTLLFGLFLPLFCVVSNAHDFEENGIYYNINPDGVSATVTFYGDGAILVPTAGNATPLDDDTHKYSGDVTIPPSVEHDGQTYDVTAINQEAFLGCEGLSSLSIPNTVTLIGPCAFYGCSGLTSMTIPESVITIGYQAFFYCSGLETATIGKSVKYFGDMAFYGCSGLKSVVWNAKECGNVKYSSGSPFYYCTSLTSVEFGNEVERIPAYLCYGLQEITSLTIPASVTEIGDRAFGRCPKLESIVVESANRKFDSRENCNAIIMRSMAMLVAGCKSTVIPSSVSDIGSYAFEGCSGLESVTIPAAVVLIGEKAFEGCAGLKSVEWDIPNFPNFESQFKSPFFGLTGISAFSFGEGVERIPSYLCYGLTKLADVNIPASVASIGFRAFGNCGGLTSIAVEPDNAKYDSRGNCNAIVESATNALVLGCANTVIPNSVSELRAYAFDGSAPVSMAIPPSISNIDKNAFVGCDNVAAVEWNVERYGDFTDADSNPIRSLSGITAFSFGDNVAEIPAYLCYGLSGISSLQIPKSVTEIGAHAFGDCPGLAYIAVAKGNPKYDSRDNCNAIVDSQSNKLVVGCRNAFIPNSVTSVGSYAFEGCSGLASIDIHSSVTTIGEKAFVGCSGLKTVNWNVAGYADCQGPLTAPFYGLDGITEFNFGDNVERIPAYLCYSLSGLTSIDIPDNVTEIAVSAFSNCQGMTSAKISDNVKKIGNLSFSRCPNLTDVVLGESVEEIGWSSFSECANLESVTIPNSVTKINAYAFAECKNLTEINFGKSIKTIDEYAFNNCSALPSVTIPESVGEIGKYAFKGCYGLTTVKWNAKNCASPSDYFYAPFFGLTNIKNFNFGNEVESIPSFLCNGLTGLTSLTIPASVTTIGGSAFRNCDKLKSVTNLAETPQEIQPDVFENVDKTACKLFVLSQSLEKYKAAAVWKEFLVEAGVEGVEADDETKTVAGYYNLQGVRIDNPERGQVSIVRYTDGSAKKIVIR
ncbi:MAG: leucine-rich repeat protein [Muribaculaceae bacterium]|nr:leucine-rich repeat protein [Muribaculaceae bacterium]